MSAQPPALPQPTWWSRNWKWFVPVLAATLLALFAVFIAMIFSLVFGMMRSSAPYQTAMSRAQANAQVQAAMGQPIQAGYFVQGSLNNQGTHGTAELAIPVSGPRGQGRIFVVARQEQDVWYYDTLSLTLANHDRIDLRTPQEREAPPPQQGDGASEPQP